MPIYKILRTTHAPLRSVSMSIIRDLSARPLVCDVINHETKRGHLAWESCSVAGLFLFVRPKTRLSANAIWEWLESGKMLSDTMGRSIVSWGCPWQQCCLRQCATLLLSILGAAVERMHTYALWCSRWRSPERMIAGARCRAFPSM
jgi:hypothetical protein